MNTITTQTPSAIRDAIISQLGDLVKRRISLETYISTLGLVDKNQDLSQLELAVQIEINILLNQKYQLTQKVNQADVKINILDEDLRLLNDRYQSATGRYNSLEARKNADQSSISTLTAKKTSLVNLFNTDIQGVEAAITQLNNDITALQSQLKAPNVTSESEKVAIKKDVNAKLLDIDTQSNQLKIKRIDRDQRSALLDLQIAEAGDQINELNPQINAQKLLLDGYKVNIISREIEVNNLQAGRTTDVNALTNLEENYGNLIKDNTSITIGANYLAKALQQHQQLLLSQEIGVNRERDFALDAQFDYIQDVSRITDKIREAGIDYYKVFLDSLTDKTKDITNIWQGNLAESVDYTQLITKEQKELSTARENLNKYVENTLADSDGNYHLAEIELNQAIRIREISAKQYDTIGSTKTSLEEIIALFKKQTKQAEELNTAINPYLELAKNSIELIKIARFEQQLSAWKNNLTDGSLIDFTYLENLLKANGKPSNIKAQYDILVKPYLDKLVAEQNLLLSPEYLQATVSDSFSIKLPFPNTTYAVNNNNYKYLTGDFNGDQKIDLVHFVNDGGAGYIIIWHSNVDGTFTISKSFAPSSYGVSNNNYKYLTGDFNGDKKTDLVHFVNDGGVGYIHIWKSNGDGTFAVDKSFKPWNGYAVNSNGYNYLAGDFNGDGKTDLVHLFNNDYIHTWLSKDDGTFDTKALFAPQGGYAIGANNYKYLTGDFNGDGKTDLIHLVSKDGVNVWFSKGDGTFEIKQPLGFKPWNTYPVDSNQYKYLTGDFNGDGKTDLIHFVKLFNSATNKDNSYAHVWLSKGDGTFEVKDGYSPWNKQGAFLPIDYSVDANNFNFQTGDFNGDGKTDLIHHVNDKYNLIWTSNSDGTFNISAPFSKSGYSLSANSYNYLTGDFNGDGKTDAVHLANPNFVSTFLSLGDSQKAQENKIDVEIEAAKQKATQDLQVLTDPLLTSLNSIINDKQRQVLLDSSNSLSKYTEDFIASSNQDVLKQYLTSRLAIIKQNSDQDLASFNNQVSNLSLSNRASDLFGLGTVVFSPTTQHYYALTSPTTWRNAQSEAVEFGGHLVTINDVNEQNFILQSFGNRQDLWIGLNDVKQEGKFEWINGEAVTYTNFNAGEPNNALGKENYVHLHREAYNVTNGKWNDLDERNYTGDANGNYVYNGSNIRGIIEIDSKAALDNLITKNREEIQGEKNTELINLKLEIVQLSQSSETIQQQFLQEYQVIQSSSISATVFKSVIGNSNIGFVSTSNWLSNNILPRQLADVNKDGKADIVGFGNDKIYISLSNGDGTFASPYTSDIGFTPQIGGWSSNDIFPRQLADVNGDGRADIVGFHSNSVWISLAQNDNTFGKVSLQNIGFTPGIGGWSSQNQYPRQLADVNGDGKADIVGFGGRDIFVSLAQNNGQFGAAFAQNISNFTPETGGWNSQDRYPRQLADVNGDGKADIVGFGNSQVFVSLAQGNGRFGIGFAQNLPFTVQTAWDSQDLFPRQLADINGDGKADIVGFKNDKIYFALAGNNGYFGASESFSLDFTAKNGFSSQTQSPRQLADIDGDGRADIIGFAQDAVRVSLNKQSKETQIKQLREKYFPGSTENVDLDSLQQQITDQQANYEKQKQDLIKTIDDKKAKATADLAQAQWYEDQAKIHWDKSRKQGPEWIELRQYKQRGFFRSKTKTLEIRHVDYDWIIWDTYTSQSAGLRKQVTDLLNGVNTLTQSKDIVVTLIEKWNKAYQSAGQAEISQAGFEAYIKNLEAEKSIWTENTNNVIDLEQVLPIINQQVEGSKKALDDAEKTLLQEQSEYDLIKDTYQTALSSVLGQKSPVDLQTQQLKQQLATAERWVNQELIGLDTEIESTQANKAALQGQINNIEAQLKIVALDKQGDLNSKKLILNQAVQLFTYHESILTKEKTNFINKLNLVQSQRNVIQREAELLGKYLQSPDNDYSNLEEELSKARTTLGELSKITKQALDSSEKLSEPLEKFQANLLLQFDTRLQELKTRQETFEALLQATKLQEDYVSQQAAQQKNLNGLESSIVTLLDTVVKNGNLEYQALLTVAKSKNLAEAAALYARDYQDLSTDTGTKCSKGIAKPEDKILAQQYAAEANKYLDLEQKAKQQASNLKLTREASQKQLESFNQQKLQAEQDLNIWQNKIAVTQAEIGQRQQELNLADIRIDILSQIQERTAQTTDQLLSIEKLNLEQAQLVQDLAEQRVVAIDQTLIDRLERTQAEVAKQRAQTLAQIQELTQIEAEKSLEAAINELRQELNLGAISIVSSNTSNQSFQDLLQQLDNLRQEPKLPNNIQLLLAQSYQDIDIFLKSNQQDITTIQDNLVKAADALIQQNDAYQSQLLIVQQEEAIYRDIYTQLQSDLQGATTKLLAEIEKTGKLKGEENLLNQQNLENLYKLANGANAVSIANILGQQPRDLLEQIIEQRVQERIVRKKAFLNEVFSVIGSAFALVSTILIPPLGAAAPLVIGLSAAAGAVGAVQAAYNGNWAGAIYQLATTILTAGSSYLSGALKTATSAAEISKLSKVLETFNVLQKSASTVYNTYQAAKEGNATLAFLTAIDGIAQAVGSVSSFVPSNTALQSLSRVLNVSSDLSRATAGAIGAFQDGQIFQGLTYIGQAAGSISSNFAQELQKDNLKSLRIVLNVTQSAPLAYTAFKSFEDGDFVKGFQNTFKVIRPLGELFKSNGANSNNLGNSSLIVTAKGWIDTIETYIENIETTIKNAAGLDFKGLIKVGKTTAEVINLFKQDNIKGWISGIKDILQVWKTEADSGILSQVSKVVSTADKLVASYETGTLNGWISGINDSLNIWQDDIQSFVNSRRQQAIKDLNLSDKSLDKVTNLDTRKIIENNRSYIKVHQDEILKNVGDPNGDIKDYVSINPNTNQIHLLVGEITNNQQLGANKSIKLYLPITDPTKVPNLAQVKEDLAKSPRDVKVIIHGLQDNIDSAWQQQIAETKEIKQSQSEQQPQPLVLIVDWGDLAGKSFLDYFSAAKNTKVVGELLAEQLKAIGVDFSRTTIIGHSLGAQVAANIGEFTKSPENKVQELGKIVALDPARPQFENSFLWWGDNSQKLENRLDGKDAKNVEIIHSSYETAFPFGLGYKNKVDYADNILIEKDVRNAYAGIDHLDAVAIYLDYLQNKNTINKEQNKDKNDNVIVINDFQGFLNYKQQKIKDSPPTGNAVIDLSSFKVDLTELKQAQSFADLRLEGTEINNVNYTWVYVQDQSQNQYLSIPGVLPSQLSANNFIFRPQSTNLNLVGTDETNTLIGNEGNDVIQGKGGNDILFGGAGNDSLNGGLGNDVVNGDGGNDVIDGAGDSTGLDTFAGGAGNDIYAVYNSATVITEDVAGGTDTVWTGVNYTLATNVENLYSVSAANSTGNNGDNLIVGYGAGNNNIYGLGGNDTIDGGLDNDHLNGGIGNDIVNGGDGNDVIDGAGDSTGLDTFAGGAGDDIYAVYNSATVITEDVAGGTDTVWTGVNYTLAANVENLYSVGAANSTGNNGDNVIVGYGAGDNNIYGLGGNDTLDGGLDNDYLNGGIGNDIVNGGDGNDVTDGAGDSTGLDTFAGGAGDDIYAIYNSATVIIENASGGNDTVWTGVNHILAANVENLYLINNAVGIGNSGNNIIYGYGVGDNIIDGGDGLDNLFGGNGNDTFILSKTSADNIGDFGVGNDRLQISASDFGGGLIANVALLSGQLRVGTTDVADTTVVRFIYNTINGNLFFDADGSAGSSSAIKIANLSGVSSLGVNSFLVV
jgi:Ca2+-binding RTX toxin-like protein